MALAAFDTHTFVKRLTKVGMPIEQAEVLSEEQARLINDRLATQNGLSRLEAGLRGDTEKLGAELRHEIRDLRKVMDAKHESLRHEIGDLRKDMDAKFAGVDARFAGIDARFTGLEERLNSRFDKLLLQLTFRLGGVIVATLTALSLLSKIFH